MSNSSFFTPLSKKEKVLYGTLFVIWFILYAGLWCIKHPFRAVLAGIEKFGALGHYIMDKMMGVR